MSSTSALFCSFLALVRRVRQPLAKPKVMSGTLGKGRTAAMEQNLSAKRHSAPLPNRSRQLLILGIQSVKNNLITTSEV